MNDKRALLVIDMQNDYLWDKRKSMFTYDSSELVGNVNRLIDSRMRRYSGSGKNSFPWV